MEIEAKFQIPDAESLRRLSEIQELAGFALSEGRLQELSDTYLDTGQWSILAAGYTCRRRVSEAQTLITLKQLRPADELLHRREEFEVVLPGDVPLAWWPEGPARDLVSRILGEEPLREMFQLHQTRILRKVGPESHPVAELSLDTVTVSGLDSPYFEVEIELLEGGTEADVELLAKTLQGEWGFVPQPLSKFQRAADALRAKQEESAAGGAPAEVQGTPAEVQGTAVQRGPVEDPSAQREEGEPAAVAPKESKRDARQVRESSEVVVLEKPGLTPDDTMAEAAAKTLLFHLLRMEQHEEGTREGEDAEELHVMRVATRRMRAALRVFDGFLDPSTLKPFLRGMRATGRTLGVVRDLDVFKIKTQAYIDSLPPEEQGGLEPLMDAWAVERELARDKMLAFLDSDRYARFRDRFDEFLRTPGAGALPRQNAQGEPLPGRVRDVLPSVLFEHLATVRAFDEWVAAPGVPLIRFHQLRIASKGLRYTLEFFQEVLGPGSKPLIDKTKLLQDHLGDLQDAIVTCEVLLGFLTSGTWGPPKPGKSVPLRPLLGASGVASFLAVKEAEIERLLRTFPPVWEQIRGPEFSVPLAALVGAL
jgi:CHAD domain-containing protein